ncbi:copper resistance CopC family protein, partial [Shewanella sp. GutDb-MelDb]|uniref:copper resistance CopC family protein n=1 Tax=Shewanella sp. GutDb-MelDb TaxID=2058316 RepID=UPI000C7D41EE
MKLVNTILLATSLIISSSVWAHVGLSSSIPAKGAMLNETPSALELSFSGTVRLIKLTLKDSKNNDFKLSIPTSEQSQDQYSLALPTLAESTYTVSWMIMGKDGHKMKGEFEFMIH